MIKPCRVNGENAIQIRLDFKDVEIWWGDKDHVITFNNLGEEEIPVIIKADKIESLEVLKKVVEYGIESLKKEEQHE